MGKMAGSSMQACLPCNRRKKRCDRALPTCSSCVKKAWRCCYPVTGSNIDGILVKSLYKRIEQLELELVRKPAPASIPVILNDGVNYPIPKRWYFPGLLSYRNFSLISIIQLYPRSIAYLLQTTWMQAAFSDACLLHATLYSTSAHMDIMQGVVDNPVTIYHKIESLRLIREAISSSDTQSIPDNVIAATLHLMYFAKLNGEFYEGISHESGIEALLRHKDMGTPRPDTIIGYFLIIQQVWNAVVLLYDTVYSLCPRAGPKATIGNPSSLLSTAVRGQIARPVNARLPPSSLELLCALENYSTSNMVDRSTSKTCSYVRQSLSSTTNSRRHSAIEKTCFLAVAIYSKAFLRIGQPKVWIEDRETRKDIARLKDEIIRSDDFFWVQCAPEVFRWVAMIGAAAAGTLAQRAWFVACMCRFCTLLEPHEIDVFVGEADHLVWLFHHSE